MIDDDWDGDGDSEHCENCGDPYPQYVENPKAVELAGDHSLHWLCDDCVESSGWDI